MHLVTEVFGQGDVYELNSDPSQLFEWRGKSIYTDIHRLCKMNVDDPQEINVSDEELANKYKRIGYIDGDNIHLFGTPQ